MNQGYFKLPESFDSADHDHFAAGVRAFRAGDFYKAHDDWEEVWQGYRGTDRRFLQGLIHIAVGTYHAECANPKGTRSQIQKARSKMEPFLPRHWGIDGAALLVRAERVVELVPDGEALRDAIGALSKTL